MSEREKMLSGELYDPSDPELKYLRIKARKLVRKYNLTDEDVNYDLRADFFTQALTTSSGSSSHRLTTSVPTPPSESSSTKSTPQHPKSSTKTAPSPSPPCPSPTVFPAAAIFSVRSPPLATSAVT